MLDLQGVIIDGSFCRGLHQQLVEAVRQALPRYPWDGIYQPEVIPGTIGSDARAIGGALMPLYANFAPDSELFLKLAA